MRAADRLEAPAFLALGRIVAAHAGQPLPHAPSAPGPAVKVRWNDAATVPWGRISRPVTSCVLKTDTQHVRLFLLCDSLMPVTEVSFLHGPADDAILGAIGRALVRHQSACKISFS
ncbi:MAG: hypothetical protein Q7T82_11305 [Armatimonadota bacterium]|nr:hypothetical protein [Armatimonadota bacterium]